MKYLVFLLTVFAAQASMAEGEIRARIETIGMSEYEDYAFVKLSQNNNNFPTCSTDPYRNELIFDINTESGSIIYATALLAMNLSADVVVFYDEEYCPLGTEDAHLTRLHLQLCSTC